MLQMAQGSSGRADLIQVQFCLHKAFAHITGIGQNLSPRVDNQAVTIGLPPIGVNPALRGGQNKTAGFYRPCPLQHMPMCLSGGLGKGRRYRYYINALLAQPAIQVRKPDIITDAQADMADICLGVDHFMPGSEIV